MFVKGNLYYLSSVGIVRYGRIKVGKKIYYFDPTTFASVTTIQRRSNGSAYLFKAGGGIKTGWQTVGGKKYYFYPTTGKMAEGLASVKDKLYYFDYNKGLLRNTTVSVGGVTYKLDENGYGKASGSSKLAKLLNAGIAHFDKGYGRDGSSSNPKNFTCSQLMTAVFSSIGIELPERGAKQHNALLYENDIEIIERIEQARPGDIIFFCDTNCSYGKKCDFWNEIHHVVMYVGDGKVMGSYEIAGDTVNNGPMIRDLSTNSGSPIIYTIVRVNTVNN